MNELTFVNVFLATFGGMAGFFFLMFIIFYVCDNLSAPQFFDDLTLKRQAKEGVIILLTCDQYLALSGAALKEYPKDPSKLQKMINGKETNIRLLSKEMKKLSKVFEYTETMQEQQKKRNDCLDELKTINQVFSSYVDAISAKNEETMRAMARQAEEIVDSATWNKG